jgi:hypothetical protein
LVQSYLIKGVAYWAKVVGKPQPGYNKDELEWSLDVVPDEASVQKLKDLGAGHYLKEKNNGLTITFKRKALKRDGEPAKPIQIWDHKNNEWDGRLIGNGSTVNVSFTLNETKTKPKRLKPSILSLQVWDLVPTRPNRSSRPKRAKTRLLRRSQRIGNPNL